jgi:hypothetical protein
MGIFSLSERKVIGTTETRITLTFHKYGERNFLQDIHLLTLRNSDLWKSDAVLEEQRNRGSIDSLGRAEILFHRDIHNAVRTGMPAPKEDYHAFRKFCAKILSQYFFYLLGTPTYERLLLRKTIDQTTKQERTVPWKEAVINLAVVDSIKEDLVAGYVDFQEHHDRTLEINFQISGALLVGRVYGLHHYTQHVDGAYLEKALGHEIEHALDGKRIDAELKVSDRLRKRIGQRFAGKNVDIHGSQAILFDGFANLRDEGLAAFQEYKYQDIFVWDSVKAYKTAQLLLKVAKQDDPQKAEEIYEKEYEPDGRSGAYLIGRLMCIVVGLAEVRRERTKAKQFATVEMIAMRTSSIGGGDSSKKHETLSVDIKNLGKELQRHKVIKLKTPLDVDAFQKTYAIVKECKPAQLFTIFFKACDELGLQGKTRFFSEELYEEIKKASKLDFERVYENI